MVNIGQVILLSTSQSRELRIPVLSSNGSSLSPSPYTWWLKLDLLSEYKSRFIQLEVTVHILNKIINAPCGTLKLLLALGVAKYIKSYKIHFVVQYATDYCPLEHDNYKTISAHLGSPISCYINNLHGAFIFLLSVDWHRMMQWWKLKWKWQKASQLIFRGNNIFGNIQAGESKKCVSFKEKLKKCLYFKRN